MSVLYERLESKVAGAVDYIRDVGHHIREWAGEYQDNLGKKAIIGSTIATMFFAPAVYSGEKNKGKGNTTPGIPQGNANGQEPPEIPPWNVSGVPLEDAVSYQSKDYLAAGKKEKKPKKHDSPPSEPDFDRYSASASQDFNQLYSWSDEDLLFFFLMTGVITPDELDYWLTENGY